MTDLRIIPQEPWAEARERYREMAFEDRPGSPYEDPCPTPGFRPSLVMAVFALVIVAASLIAMVLQ